MSDRLRRPGVLELDELVAEGVSPWLDGLTRRHLASGCLTHLIAHTGVRGATSDPAALAAAVETDDAYREQLAGLASDDICAADAVRAVAAHDLRWACDELRPVYQATRGLDGMVSMDLDPHLMRDVESVVAEAEQTLRAVNRPNAMVKLPATTEGIAAIRECVGEGFPVHVTAVFSVSRYRQALGAYVEGLQRALADGRRLPALSSVVSLPVGLLDAEVDARLEELGTPDALALRGKAALARARHFYQMYDDWFGGTGWRALAAAGGHPQRLMWTATTVTDPSSSPTRYVERLVTWGTITSMTLPTLEAAVRHLALRGDTLMGRHRAALEVWGRLERLGIDGDEIARKLEAESAGRLAAAWRDLYAAVDAGRRTAHRG
ncbi:transaldolase family protein [Streptomyces afghaniensis]|uniref:transaldolase family protein n=1 Tax=Streptomyces afghaniensis TaxID=66865 RepID=UPI002782289B|nr:transaldolase family protein [Streptomyces afghaniensis]MDQ1014618.1 transaldolase [Streptomyces afghaniensis]